MKLRFALLILWVTADATGENRPDEGAEFSDVILDLETIIRKYRYPVETHHTTTEDGYVLTVHRIPYGRLCPREQSKGPVLLVHGVFSSSVHFVISGTKRGLGYILADSCYDVWMANLRGNVYSLNHVHYSNRSSEYWNFTWHEVGLYDYPAIMDLILQETKADVSVIAHSLGTTSFLVFNIFRPEYNPHIRSVFLMAPIAFLGNSKSILLQMISRIRPLIKEITNSYHIYNFMDENGVLNRLIRTICPSFRPVNPKICQSFAFMIIGYDFQQSNMTLISIVTGKGFYGSSLKQLYHYAQLIESHKFRQFDYKEKNIIAYGQKQPPEYDLSKVNAPIHLICGQNDWLSDLRDVETLIPQLMYLQETFLIDFPKFNHLDHLFAIDVVDLSYNHIIEQLNTYY